MNVAPLKMRRIVIGIGITMAIAIEWVDYLTPSEMSFELFYLIPICLFVWYIGKWVGIGVAFAAVFSWWMTHYVIGSTYSKAHFLYWDIFVRIFFFLLVILLLSSLKTALNRANELSRTDDTTGVANRRYLIEILGAELKRAQRYHHPISIAYLDLDNFKEINDRFGHSAGDLLLKQVAGLIKSQIRSVDLVARLGGDEFGIILPETGSDTIKGIFEKIQESLNQSLKEGKFPLTLSIGVVTCYDPFIPEDRLLQEADQLMYFSKKNGKNQINYLKLGEMSQFGVLPNS